MIARLILLTMTFYSVLATHASKNHCMLRVEEFEAKMTDGIERRLVEGCFDHCRHDNGPFWCHIFFWVSSLNPDN